MRVLVQLLSIWGVLSQASFPKIPSFPEMPSDWSSFSSWRGPMSFTTGTETVSESQKSYRREFSTVTRAEGAAPRTPRIIVEPPIINVGPSTVRYGNGTLANFSNSTSSLQTGRAYELDLAPGRPRASPQSQASGLAPSSAAFTGAGERSFSSSQQLTSGSSGTPTLQVSVPQLQSSQAAYAGSSQPRPASPRPRGAVAAPAPIDLQLPEINLPQMNLHVGGSRIEVAQPVFREPAPIVINLDDIEVPAKKILVRAPKVNIGAPQVQVEQPRIVSEPVQAPRLKINLASPTVRLTAPSVQFSEPIINSPVDLDLPRANINIGSPNIRVPAPRFQHAQPDMTITGEDVTVPASNINVAGLQFNYKGPDIDLPEPVVTFDGRQQAKA